MQQHHMTRELHAIEKKAVDISEIIRFYRDIVKQISTQNRVYELVQFGNKEDGIL